MVYRGDSGAVATLPILYRGDAGWEWADDGEYLPGPGVSFP